MATPLVFIEEELRRRAGLVKQLELMENSLADPRRTPAFGTHSNRVSTTQAEVEALRAQIADIDERVERMRAGNA